MPSLGASIIKHSSLESPLTSYLPYPEINKGEQALTEFGPDARQISLEKWLSLQLGQDLIGVSASSDASFRRYFRYTLSDRSLIAMDAPPETEDCRPFVKVASLLAGAGVLVPDVIAEDLDRGFLLLSDLGSQTFLEVMTSDAFDMSNASPMFEAAIDSLILIQRSGKQKLLPPYDGKLLHRELELFVEWYLQRHLGLDIDPELRRLLDSLFDQLVDQVSAQATTFVHRDYMPRNLMVADDQFLEGHNNTPIIPGVLDFQDAVCGPISYDPICLFKDAFISWPENVVRSGLQQYWVKAVAAELPVPEDFEAFLRDCDYMGAQRHLKVIGIFSRICHRDGKPRYLTDVPRFFAYLDTVAKRRPELSALSRLLKVVKQRTSESIANNAAAIDISSEEKV
mgnify:CR=1 FL=1